MDMMASVTPKRKRYTTKVVEMIKDKSTYIPSPVILCLSHKQPLRPPKMHISSIALISDPHHLTLSIRWCIAKPQLKFILFSIFLEKSRDINSVGEMHITTFENFLAIE